MSLGVCPVSIQFRKAGALLLGGPVSSNPKLPGVFVADG
jgi:hypothetical protein